MLAISQDYQGYTMRFMFTAQNYQNKKVISLKLFNKYTPIANLFAASRNVF